MEILGFLRACFLLTLIGVPFVLICGILWRIFKKLK